MNKPDLDERKVLRLEIVAAVANLLHCRRGCLHGVQLQAVLSSV